MNNKKQHINTLCGESLKGSLHICAFFDSRDEHYEILLPWLKEGIDSEETVLNILAGELHNEHCTRLADSGIPVEDALARKQLKIVAAEESYIHGGTFAAQRMFNIVEQAIVDAQTSPYSRFRGCGDMEWALKNLPGTDELMEYEARLNLLTAQHECSILCSYDISKFSGKAIADILATHPQVIMNGKIHRNPHYMEPVEFLGRLIRRPRRSLSTETDSVS